MAAYTYDFVLTAAITLLASSEAEARKLLAENINCATANLGSWPNGDPIICEVTFNEDNHCQLATVVDIEL